MTHTNMTRLSLILLGWAVVGCASNKANLTSDSGAAGSAASTANPAAGKSGAAGSGGTGVAGVGAAGSAIPVAGTTPKAGTGGASGKAAIAGTDGQDDAGTTQTDSGAGNNLPPTGTFPAVQDVSAKGPFTAKTVSNTGPGNAYTLYHPMELGPGGVLNPIVSWGNGGGTTPGLYPMLPRLASHGFVVIAANASAVTGDQVRAGVDWLVQQNDLMTSPFYHKLDTKNVSGVGYSLGGLATFAIADDPRVVTIVIISGANMADKTPVAKLHTPSAYFCTDDDASQGNCDGDYAVVTAPTFYGVMKGTEHVDVVLDSATADRLTKVTTAWLRWQQMADQTQKRLFVGTGCLLCTDSQWVVQQKNGLM